MIYLALFQAEDYVEQTQHDNSPEQDSGSSQTGVRELFAKYGPSLMMAVLLCYIILLGIGVFAEIFKIQRVLDWWIWSPPGKFK